MRDADGMVFIFNINGSFILHPTCNMVGIVFACVVQLIERAGLEINQHRSWV